MAVKATVIPGNTTPPARMPLAAPTSNQEAVQTGTLPVQSTAPSHG